MHSYLFFNEIQSTKRLLNDYKLQSKSFEISSTGVICHDDATSREWAGIQANFELWPIFHSIYLIPTLNLRQGLNSMAFFTYIVKFPAFKLVSFMAYTYNIQGWRDGTRRQSPLARPRDSHPRDSPTAPCQLSLCLHLT